MYIKCLILSMADIQIWCKTAFQDIRYQLLFWPTFRVSSYCCWLTHLRRTSYTDGSVVLHAIAACVHLPCLFHMQGVVLNPLTGLLSSLSITFGNCMWDTVEIVA